MELRVKPDLCPCVMLKNGTRALFHGYSRGEAVVEHPGDYVSLVSPEYIRFCDSKEKFAEYAWDGDASCQS